MGAVLRRGRAFRFRARGSSMLPFVCDGDVLTVSPLAGKAPRLGELLAFLHPQSGKPTIHRVVELRRGACLMRGDAVHTEDGWVDAAGIQGRVTEITRAGRSIHWGLGPERALIAIISRMGLWRALREVLWWWQRRTHRCATGVGTDGRSGEDA